MKSNKKIIAAAAALVLLPSFAFAAGYQLDESSPYWAGMANAGIAASDNEVSSIFSNPANLSSLKSTQIYVGGILLLPKISYNNASGYSGIPANGPLAPATGVTSEGNISRPTPVPNMSFGKKLTPTITGGISVTAPFGTYLHYSPDSVLRNSALDTSLQTVAVSPALSWQVNDQWALGFALNVMDTRAEYSNNIVDNGSSSSFIMAMHSDIKMSGLGLGWTLGTTYKPTKDTTIGASYRSNVNQSLSGTGTANMLNPAMASLAPQSATATAVLPLPDVYTLSLMQKITPQLELGFTARHTMWSRLQTLGAVVTNPVGLNFSTAPKWRDTTMYSIGGQYAVNQQLTLRTGVAYDQTPTYDATRDARSPDGDRTWLTAGASYKLGKNLSLDASYAHIWIANSTINTNENGSMVYPAGADPVISQWTSKANFQGAIDELGMAVRYTF